MALDGSKLTGVLTFLAGCAGAACAVPPLLGAIAMAPGTEVVHALGQPRAKTPAVTRLQAAVEARGSAMGWYATANGWAELGALHIAIARDKSLAPRVRNAHYDQAVTAVRNALLISPVLPYAWSHYAYAVLARDGGQARIDAPLLMSLNTAPFEPALVRQRIEIGFVADKLLAPETRKALQSQVLLAARGNMGALVRFVRRERALGWVRAALAADPALQQRFDVAYLRSGRI